MTSALDLALAGAIGALAGSALAPLIETVRDIFRTRHDDRHRLEDVRRDSYGDAVAWLIPLRDKVASTRLMLFACIQTECDPKLVDVVEEYWVDVVERVAVGLPEAMGPVMRVASDAVVDGYKRLTANSTFWKRDRSQIQYTIDNVEEMLRDIPSERWAEEMKKQQRPMTRLEIVEGQRSGSQIYLNQLDLFIHLLRTEVGLSSASGPEYLTPD